ncbi:MAG: hypothetical protein ROZ37_15820 [Aromatoleum sp.]|jgi:hypothetical protein|uniref:hypothetical protein n=1 Tax=Aromatoleum sp. TaxID=2307007 RepID=UPI00289583C3|nr:hypothetical protein [Aromatoleum sp.]MDT3671784.1 hypothetical protein [Aromatoleum sp.]
MDMSTDKLALRAVIPTRPRNAGGDDMRGHRRSHLLQVGLELAGHALWSLYNAIDCQ